MNTSNASFCFGCTHIRGGVPAGKKSEIDELTKTMGNDLTTTSFHQHATNISNQYRDKIQKKVNSDILKKNPNAKVGIGPGFLLPDWTPEMVKEHLEGHHNDPQLSVELIMHRLKNGMNFIWKESLVEKKLVDTNDQSSSVSTLNSLAIKKKTHTQTTIGNGRNQQGNLDNNHQNPNVLREEARLEREQDDEDDEHEEEEEEEIRAQENVQEELIDEDNSSLPSPEKIKYVRSINPEQWKILKEMMDSYLKFGKSKPETMTPYYKKDRFVMEAYAKHPYFDISSKHTFSEKDSLSSVKENSASYGINFAF